jgi:hypothetical protein
MVNGRRKAVPDDQIAFCSGLTFRQLKTSRNADRRRRSPASTFRSSRPPRSAGRVRRRHRDRVRRSPRRLGRLKIAWESSGGRGACPSGAAPFSAGFTSCQVSCSRRLQRQSPHPGRSPLPDARSVRQGTHRAAGFRTRRSHPDCPAGTCPHSQLPLGMVV